MYGKKSGDVEISEYSQPGFVLKFEVLSKHLQEKFGKEKLFTAKNLSLFTGHLTKYMEKWAGRDSPRPTPFTRIPAEILRDFSIDGPLALILTTCFDFRRRKNLNKIDFTDETRVEMFNTMFQQCIKALKKKGYLPERRIFLSKDLANNARYDIEKLKEIITHHGAVAVEDKEKASHIIVSDQFFEEADEDYLRTLVVDKEREVAFVHWWYYPSSYDEWVPLKMVQGEPEPKKTPPHQWEIQARWLLDTAKFNEWIPEADYELEEFEEEEEHPQVRVQVQAKAVTEEPLQETPARREPVAKPKKTQKKSPQPKRVVPHISDDEITDDDEDLARQSQKRPRKRTRNTTDRPNKRQKSDEPRRPAYADVPHDIAPGVVDLQPSPGNLDDIPYTGPVLTKVTVKRPLYPVVVPSYANWFNQGMIHRIEWEEFADILRGDCSKTELYVRVRDTLVNTFRLNPRIHLSCTTCRRLVTADAGLVFRIHRFLEKWSLINYYVDEGTIPDNGVAQIKATHVQSPNGVKRINTSGGPPPKKRPQLDLLSSCSFSGGGLGTSYYRWKPNSDVVASATVVGSGQILGLNKEDFDHEMNPEGTQAAEEKDATSDWTEADTERLIEALNIYNDDWNEIAQHTGKTVEECVKRFVELPLDDAEIKLNHDIHPNEVNVFADGSNPIMRQAAFIASLVSPDVAAVAAKASLQYMRKKDGFENPLSKVTPDYEVGKEVFTKYGEGTITEVRENDVLLKLDYGIAAIQKSECELSFKVDENEKIEGEDEIEKLRSVAAGSLGASATNAAKLANKKEKSLQELLRKLLFLEMEKIRVKTKQLEDLWSLLEKERSDIQLTRQFLLKERIELTQHLLKVQRIIHSQKGAPRT